MNITGTDNVDHVVQVLADQEMVILSEIVSHAAQMPKSGDSVFWFGFFVVVVLFF